MSYTYLLVVLEYLIFSLHFKEYLCQHKVASSCNGNNLQINCLDNEKIAIERIFFGARSTVSPLDCNAEGETNPACCRRGYGDCIAYNSNTATIVTRLCTGRQTCLYPTRSVKIDRCQDPTLESSDYMTVYYNCIPGTSTVNICSDDKIQAKPPLYLSNKEYPLPRTGFSNCTCMIVKHPSQSKLTLRAIEISFIDPQCSVSLTVEHGEDLENKFPCNYKMGGYRQWLEVTSDSATVSLTNKEDQGDTYFWMQIDTSDVSEDLVSLYCGDALEKFLNPDSMTTGQTTTNAPSVTTMQSTHQATTMESTHHATTMESTHHATTIELSTSTMRETSKMTTAVQTTTEEDMITRSGTSTLKSQTTKRTAIKPVTTQIITVKPMTTTSTTMKPMTTKSTTMKPITTKSTMKPMATQSTTTKQEMIDRNLSTTNLTTENPTSSSTFTFPSTTKTTTKFVPRVSTTTITTIKPQTTTVSMDRSSKGLVIRPQKKHCFGTCHDTFGHGFTLNLKSFINPSKVKKYCRKINDLLSCFESKSEECSSTEKMDADKELRANVAGRQVICEENLSEVQYMTDCYNRKNFRRELSSCDQLLYPFENVDKTEICKLKKEFVDCVRDVVDDCNDTTVSTFMYNVTNRLFDFLYKTEDCDTESVQGDKEPEVMVTEKPTPEPEVDDGANKSTQQPVVPEKKAGDDKRNAAPRVQGIPYPFNILLIANLMIFLS
ncbi:uncharacterized protein LOC133205255 [Saccostrea echinata]|uniref:uncharacterized protein LOC133205255 n=1 Tax=Saccostrea echinata TaxID=191078 RepID=UPI002A7FABA2|nr:uncharacterized protein LOC133205255 [Saccostrea echinata]